MKTVLKWILLVPLVAVLLVFALANRHDATITFDPFDSSMVLAFTEPLFVFLGLATMIGVAIGGTATWFAQGHHRRAGRQARAEAERLRAENERLALASRAKVTPIALPRNAA